MGLGEFGGHLCTHTGQLYIYNLSIVSCVCQLLAILCWKAVIDHNDYRYNLICITRQQTITYNDNELAKILLVLKPSCNDLTKQYHDPLFTESKFYKHDITNTEHNMFYYA